MASDQDSWIQSALGVDVGSIVSKVKSVASSAVDTASNMATAAVDDVKSAGSAVADTAATVTSAAAAEVKSTVNEVTSEAKAAVATATKVASAAKSTFTKAATTAAKAVSTAASATEDAAGKAWKDAKAGGGAVVDEAKDIYKGMQGNAKLVKEGEGYVNKGIDWLENEAKSGTKWAADQAKGIPVVEQVAKGVEETVDQDVDFAGGVLKGATGLVGGVVGVVADPVDTAKGLYTMSEHLPGIGLPAKALAEAYDVATTDKTIAQAGQEMADPTADDKYWTTVGKALVDPIVKSVKDGKPMEGVGQAATQIGSLLIGAGEVGAAAEVAEAAGTAGKVAEVADVAATAGKVADVADVAGTAGKVADIADTAGKAADVADTAGSASKAADAAAGAKQVHAPPEPPVDPGALTERPTDPHAPEIDPESPTEHDPEKPQEEESGEPESEGVGDKPPEDPYDVEGWEKYYAKHPEVKRSVGAAGANDPKMAGEGEEAEEAGEAEEAEDAAKGEDPDATPPYGITTDGKRVIRMDKPQVTSGAEETRVTWSGDPKAVVQFKPLPGGGVKIGYINVGSQAGDGAKMLATALRKEAERLGNPAIAKPAFLESDNVVNQTIEKMVAEGETEAAENIVRRLSQAYGKELGGKVGKVVFDTQGEKIVVKIKIDY
jgi:hypothetical protein